VKITMAVFAPVAGAVVGAQVFSDLSSTLTNNHQLLVTLGAVLGSMLAKIFAQKEVKQHAETCAAHGEIPHILALLNGLSDRVLALESKKADEEHSDDR
jgi:uncharacterized membrane protein YfcA